MALKKKATTVIEQPAPEPVPAPAPAPATDPNRYLVTFGVVHFVDGIGTHGAGTNKSLVVTLDSNRKGAVPDHSDGDKLVVMRVYNGDESDPTNEGEVVALLNHDHDRVRTVIDQLRAQLETVSDPDVERDLNQQIAYYASHNDEYPTSNAFIAVLEFRVQTKRDSSVQQLVAKLGQRIDGRSGVPVFAKKGISMPNEDGESTWSLCAVFMNSNRSMGVAVAMPDPEAIKESIASLLRQDEAIGRMNGLAPVNGEAKAIARQLMGALKRA